MKFKIEKEVFKKFGSLNVGIVIIKGMDNQRNGSGVIPKMIEEISMFCRDKYVLNGFSKDKYLTNWKNAYGKGKKMPKYHTAVENLLHDVLLGKEVPHRNNLVDLYRYFMLKYMIPIGGDDLDKVNGDIKLKLAEGWEVLRPEHQTIEHPEPQEIIYTDNKQVLARRWSWHESRYTKITHNTKNAVIYFDALRPFTYQALESIMKEFIDLVKTFNGGKVRYKILNLVNTSARI